MEIITMIQARMLKIVDRNEFLLHTDPLNLEELQAYAANELARMRATQRQEVVDPIKNHEAWLADQERKQREPGFAGIPVVIDLDEEDEDVSLVPSGPPPPPPSLPPPTYTGTPVPRMCLEDLNASTVAFERTPQHRGSQPPPPSRRSQPPPVPRSDDELHRSFHDPSVRGRSSVPPAPSGRTVPPPLTIRAQHADPCLPVPPEVTLKVLDDMEAAAEEEIKKLLASQRAVSPPSSRFPTIQGSVGSRPGEYVKVRRSSMPPAPLPPYNPVDYEDE